VSDPAVASIIAVVSASAALATGIGALVNSRSKASSAKLNELVSIIDVQSEHIECLTHKVEVQGRAIADWRFKYRKLLAWIRKIDIEPPHEVLDCLCDEESAQL